MRVDARPPLVLALGLIVAGAGFAAAPVKTPTPPDYLTFVAPPAVKAGAQESKPADEEAADSATKRIFRDAQGDPIDIPASGESIAPPVDVAAKADLAPSPPPADALDLVFDLGVLPPEEMPPPPKPVEPPPDPAAALKSFAYVGAITSGAEARAMFSGAEGVRILSKGMSLEGFVLESFDMQSAKFTNGSVSVVMGLGSQN